MEEAWGHNPVPWQYGKFELWAKCFVCFMPLPKRGSHSLKCIFATHWCVERLNHSAMTQPSKRTSISRMVSNTDTVILASVIKVIDEITVTNLQPNRLKRKQWAYVLGYTLFTNRVDVLPQNLVKSRSYEFHIKTFPIALKFQGDTIIITNNLVVWRLHEIWR